MKWNFTYKEGDYVNYEGNLSTLSKILRDPDCGRIEKFEVHHEIERIYLYLLNKKDHIWCDYQDIKPIYTEPEHLNALGFKTVQIGSRKKYELDAIVISGALIQTPKEICLLRYCMGDFTKGIVNIDGYFKDGRLDLDMFTTDFPNVDYLNDLLRVLEARGRIIDKEAIVFSKK